MINNKSLEDVREYFLLSQSVYKVSEKHQAGDWVKRDDLNLSTATQNSDTGFKSAIFFCAFNLSARVSSSFPLVD